MDSEQNVYEGETCDNFKIHVSKWNYFKLVDILKELGYSEVNTIYYKDSTFEMIVLIDDKDALDIVV